VILKLFEEDAAAHVRLPRAGSALGSPSGSRTAHTWRRLPFGKRIWGLGVAEELARVAPAALHGARDLGSSRVILGVGLGRLVGTLGGPTTHIWSRRPSSMARGPCGAPG